MEESVSDLHVGLLPAPSESQHIAFWPKNNILVDSILVGKCRAGLSHQDCCHPPLAGTTGLQALLWQD